MSLPRLRPFALAALTTLLVSGGALVHAQDVTEGSLKGAFIFNFARFTQWPSESLPPSVPLSACVVGDRAVGAALKRAAANQKWAGRPIVVSLFEPHEKPTACHFLYVSGVARARMAEIVYGVHETPVLTVSDDDTFIKLGGMIQVFIERGNMRFRINPKSAKRAQLQLSSSLLALADLVDADAPVPPPLAVPTSKAR